MRGTAHRIHDTAMVQPGARFRFNANNPHLISYTSMPPTWRGLTVVWVENDHVHYRMDGTSLVDQTPLDRFMQACEPEPKP